MDDVIAAAAAGALAGGRRVIMGVFKKQGAYGIDYYVSSHRKRERIGADKQMAETVLQTYKGGKKMSC
jgi:hypothetical protein